MREDLATALLMLGSSGERGPRYSGSDYMVKWGGGRGRERGRGAVMTVMPWGSRDEDSSSDGSSSAASSSSAMTCDQAAVAR